MKWPAWLRRKPLVEPPPETPPTEESRLRLRVGKAADGAPLSAEDWTLVDGLVARGREQQAIELVRNFVVSRPDDVGATLRLAELLCGRLEHVVARPLLERVTTSGNPAQRLRALHLLAEDAERAGDVDRARRTWERVLARDIDHPQARAAIERLRLAPRRRAHDLALPTLDGPAQVGAPVGGRYRLRGELGRGASGTVYRADDVAIGRELALKILHPHARGAGGVTEGRLRAWQEARVSATLRHPGVAAIYDLDEERQLISMELCRGGSLRERLLDGALHARDALVALTQLCDVLAAAHAAGIVHGDVKPANVLLRSVSGPLGADDVVLCDFGVARLAFLTPEGRGRAAGSGESDDAAPAVEQRAARGTLVYMAPEQRRGQLGPASDVWAAGVVALELLGGHDALARALGDRAALLRGDLLHVPTLSPAVATALAEAAAGTHALLADLLAKDATSRPSAADAGARARALSAML